MSAPPPGPPVAAAAVSNAAADDTRTREDASSNRRVQLRRFPAGPHPQPGDAAALSDAHPLPPPVRLYRHALECVFAFFKLPELPTLLLVSREWQSAVLSMKSLGLRIVIDEFTFETSLGRLTALCTSRLRCHVQCLNCSYFPVNSSALNMLSLKLPQLEDLPVLLELSAVPPLFPTKLRELRFQMEPYQTETRVSFFQQTMEAIGSLKLLADLRIDSRLPAGVSLVPLSRLPQLRRLHIECREADWSDARITELRSLGDLEYVHLYGADPMLWSRVLAEPHSLRWQELRGFGYLSESILQRLISLPLTKLNAYLVVPHIDQVVHLPQLTELELFTLWCDFPFEHERIFHTVGSLVQLQQLRLHDKPQPNALHFTDADMCGALPRLVQLRSLTIRYATELTTLFFLTQGALPVTLTELHLEYFVRRLPIAELQHVLRLNQLHKLTLKKVFDQFISPADEQLFQPPVQPRLMPHLIFFEHERCTLEEDEEEDDEDVEYV